jgi:DNA modification methylase
VFCRKNEIRTFNANKKIKSISEKGQYYYENVFNFIEAKNNDGSCSLNKATFSTELVLKLLDIYSVSEDDVVLDPFLGTGTTALGCIKANRKYIGFELSPKQFKYAQDRLNGIDNKKQENLSKIGYEQMSLLGGE